MTTATTAPRTTEAGLALASLALEAIALGLRLVLSPALALLLTAAGCGHEAVRQARRARAQAARQLHGLSVRELRQLAREAGHRALARSGRRAELLTVLGA